MIIMDTSLSTMVTTRLIAFEFLDENNVRVFESNIKPIFGYKKTYFGITQFPKI